MKTLPEQPALRRDGGYTLMELLVVLAIMGLLVGLATPIVLRYLDHAKVSTAKTEISNISAGLDLFKLDVGRYPTSGEGLGALLKKEPGMENWNGPYIKKAVEIDDPWGHPYLYRSPGLHGDFDLYSDRQDPAKPGSPDKPMIANW